MRPEAAPAIRLDDYTPAPYLIDTVALNFRLAPKATTVTARLSVRRQEDTAPGTPLVLDGDGLVLAGLALDGFPLSDDAYTATPDRLEISKLPEHPFELEIRTTIDPDANTELMGLYRSSGTYCTQCEAEGFRRITYFLDRPDVLAVYTTRIEARKSEAPVLLGNGNPVSSGDIEGTDRHFAVWHDPFPKPSYLFALVAGDLGHVADTFTTCSGRRVDLKIYVEHGKRAVVRLGHGFAETLHEMGRGSLRPANTISTSSTSSPCPTSTWARWRTRASMSSTTSTCWPIRKPRPIRTTPISRP
jgi:aminopeptidase N